jgi:hypothetical protein
MRPKSTPGRESEKRNSVTNGIWRKRIFEAATMRDLIAILANFADSMI